jgi:hypothetical protein
MTEKHYESFSFGLFVLFAGILSLLVTLGFLSWALVLQFLIAYWPLFIIIAGLRIIGNAQLETGYFGLILDLLFYGLILVSLVYAGDKLFLAFDQKPSESATEAVNRSQFPQAKTKEYTLNFGAADVTIRDESTNRFLMASGPTGFSVARDERQSEVAGITLKNETTMHILRFANFRKPEKFSVELGVPEMPASVEVNLGASNGSLELDQSILTKLQTNVGAGNLETVLSGSSIPSVINLRVGAGKTVLRLVGEDSVRLEFSVGAGSLKLISEKRDFSKEFGGVGTKGVYEVIPNPRITINVSVGAGAVEVRLE